MHVSINYKEKFLSLSVEKDDIHNSIIVYKLENSAPPPQKWIVLQGERN